MTLSQSEPDETAALLEDLSRLGGRPCASCSEALCAHEALVSLVLGFKDTPRCLPCLARELGREVDDLRDGALAHVERRDCFLEGWRWASHREGFGNELRPACLWGAGAGEESSSPSAGPEAEPLPAEVRPDVKWDAGDMSCGDLVLELRNRLRALPAASVMEVVARDPGALEDLPAWCRLTGHRLAAARHPIYWIKKKEG